MSLVSTPKGTMCMASVHDVRADTLVRDDRILLKDMRVLEITDVAAQEDGLTIRYYQLAAKEQGSLDVTKGQMVKLLCGGRCHLSRTADSLI